MLCKEVFQGRNKKLGIMNRFILIRRRGFLFYNNIGMSFEKVFVVKRNMTNNTQSVCDNSKLKDIAKVSVDVKLFDFRISRNASWHRTISDFVGVIISVKTH